MSRNSVENRARTPAHPSSLDLARKDMAESASPRIVIVGGGLAGLFLSLSLKKQLGAIAEIYEQAPRFGTRRYYRIGVIYLWSFCPIRTGISDTIIRKSLWWFS
jgi:hypothetical protein